LATSPSTAALRLEAGSSVWLKTVNSDCNEKLVSCKFYYKPLKGINCLLTELVK